MSCEEQDVIRELAISSKVDPEAIVGAASHDSFRWQAAGRETTVALRSETSQAQRHSATQITATYMQC